MNIQSIDEYYADVMARGTEEAKCLITTEALMCGTLARKLAEQLNQSPASARTHAHEIQRELMCLLHTHRGPVLAGFLMERGRGLPLAVEGPVVVPGGVEALKG